MTTPEETPVTLDGKKGDLDVEYYTPQEVGLKFRVDARTVVRWVKQGKFDEFNIQMVKTLGGHRRYRKIDVDRVFAELNPHLLEKPESEISEERIEELSAEAEQGYDADMLVEKPQEDEKLENFLD